MPVLSQQTSMEQALKVAGVPLQSETERAHQLDIASKQWGVDGLDAQRVLGPLWQNFDIPAQARLFPRRAARSDELGRSVAFSTLSGTLAHHWRDDYRTQKILTGMLGEYGPALYAHVMEPLPYISAMAHAATSACFMMQLSNKSPAATVAMWDNGVVVDDPDELHMFWQVDYPMLKFGRQEDWLKWPNDMLKKPDYSKWLAPASIVKPAVVDALGGRLTVLSGAHRLDIKSGADSLAVRRTKIEPIVGNLVVAALPYAARSPLGIAPKQRRKS